MRSATAHKIFEDDPRFEVKSAGTDKSAATPLSPELMDWADAIIVMEKHHRNFIRSKQSHYYNSKKIVCLYIPDVYEFMQSQLIHILKMRVDEVYKQGLLHP
jgi:predicted protein tyrosine phosphatase